MQAINSFVLFDLETTGLPQPGTKTKITEIAMQAMTRANLMSAAPNVPRISNKLVLCVNPVKEIDPVAAKITGLDNQSLKPEKAFNKDLFLSMAHFLERLPPPICLVAHNGTKFDFPILQAELNDIGQELGDEILCVDSLLAFQSLFPRGSSPPLQEAQPNGSVTVGPPKKRPKTSSTLKNHKLDELHKFLVSVRKRDNCHSAEGDVNALAACIARQSTAFVGWADANAVPFSAVKEMWGTRVKLIRLRDD